METHRTRKDPQKESDLAVLLIPDVEIEGDLAPYGIEPGEYSKTELLNLLEKHKNDPSAVQFIADMLETGNPEEDQFVMTLRDNLADVAAIEKIISECRKP